MEQMLSFICVLNRTARALIYIYIALKSNLMAFTTFTGVVIPCSMILSILRSMLIGNYCVDKTQIFFAIFLEMTDLIAVFTYIEMKDLQGKVTQIHHPSNDS